MSDNVALVTDLVKVFLESLKFFRSVVQRLLTGHQLAAQFGSFIVTT